MLEAPVLALLLAFYTRSAKDASGMITEYTFSQNANIPAYLFMSVIVAIFLGLVISAEEIFRDRKILMRERFLSLSRWSYLSSKVTILFMISAIQMFLFVIIGNSILEIGNMTWRYFLILFTASCWANLIGLNISSGLKSIVTIYIFIPLILVPQLLFSGVVVDFRNLNKAIYSDRFVPAIGEVMTSHWAYEALVVTQFKDNPFEKKIYAPEQKMNESMYVKAYVIPKIESVMEEVKLTIENRKEFNKVQEDLSLLKAETENIARKLNSPPPQFIDSLKVDKFSEEVYDEAIKYYENAWSIFHSRYLDAIKKRNEALESLKIKKSGAEDLYNLKRKNYNDQLASVVKNDWEMVEMVVSGNRIIRLRDPIFTMPETNYGRAHFYAPYKKVAGFYIDTFWFNLIFVWFWTGLWFVILYYDLLRKVINYFDNIKLQRFNRRILLILKQYERQ